MILRIDALIDTEGSLATADDIAALIGFLFEENSHLATLMVCQVNEVKKKEHNWVWYMNGTFCSVCNAAIGSPQECI